MSAPDTFYPPRRLQQPLMPPTPFAWAALTPEEERLYLEGLELWVLWLAERYNLDHRVIPPCWSQHAELIEELSALHLAWEGSFAPTAAHDGPLLWHERFANARQRLGDWIARTGCRPDDHRGR